MTRSPATRFALHCALLGGLLYVLGLLVGSLAVGPDDVVEKRPLQVSAGQVERMHDELLFQLGRPPSRAELGRALDRWIEQEVLVRHALHLGLDREPAVERRLAQIGAFVDGSAERATSEAALADQARALGLHRSDQVVRNILVDRASRLIRAAVLAHEPTDAALEAHLDANTDAFRPPGRVALEHVEVRGEDARGRAASLLAELRSVDPSGDALARWGDRPSVPSTLRAQPERALARRFGHRFAGALGALPTGQWSGPVESRHGWHLVRIVERQPGGVPALDEARDAVRAHWRHALAEQWHDERMAQLRSEYALEVAGTPVTGSVVAAFEGMTTVGEKTGEKTGEEPS